MQPTLRRLCLLACLLAAPALGAPDPSPPAAPLTIAQPGADLESFIRLYTTDRDAVQRFHRLPWCEQSMDRMGGFYRQWEESLAALDFDALDQAGKIDFLLLRTELASETSRLARERRQLAEMDPLLPFRTLVLDLELSRRRMEAPDNQKAATALSHIPDLIKAVREKIEKGKDEKATDGLKVSPALARRTSRAASELSRTLAGWFDSFDSFKPEFGWWVDRPYQDARKAIDEFARYLREDIAGQRGRDDDPLVGDPIGAEGLKEDLAGEMLAYTPQELIAIGEREFAWCENEMRRASAEMGLGDDWKAALRQVKDDHVPPGEQDALVRDQSRDAIRFIQDRDLVTIPDLCLETWRLEMISTEGQKSLPFAAYGGQHMLVAYATNEMTLEDRQMSMRGNNRAFSRIVTPHELIPGHHLQGFMAQRVRPYRGLFGTPFYVEGWAVYWEITLWNLGYPQSPQDRIGMLFWRMHRCARIIVSLKFHLGAMTPPEMIDFLVDRVGHERFGATSEVRRYIAGDYSPLYQCGYMIGALQLRELYKELVDGGKMTPKQFNDAVLACNSVPIEMVRAQLAGTKLTQDWAPLWRLGNHQ